MPKILSLPVDEIASLRSRVRHHRLVPAGATPAQIAEHAARVREFWTPERRRAAIPPPMPPARETAAGEGAPEDVTKPTRVPKKQLGTPPYSSVGKFLFQFEEGGMYHRGSGFAVGPNLVMTAAHCVVSLHDKRPPQPAINVLFEPQFDDGDSPLGSFAGVDVFYMVDYAHADGDIEFDYAFALVQPMPSGVPALPLDFLEPRSGSVNALGYPIDKNGKFHFDQGERMWEQPSSYMQKTIKQSSFLRMPSMFTPGASGGPWIDSQSNQVVSLNSTRSGEQRIDGPILGSAAYVLYQTVSGAMVNWSVDTNCGNYVTSVLFSPTNNVAYTGVNGYAYGYDIANGTQGAYNRLTGYRHNELRFATDGTNLYVGTNGYLLALPLDNFDDELAQIGEMQVGGPTTVLWDAGTSSVYAGATAQVCRLTGSQLSYNTLKGLQGGDVDLVTDGTNLYAGTGGQVTAIALSDFESETRLWTSAITQSQGDVVHVAMLNGGLYAAAGGAMCQLDTATGAISMTGAQSGVGEMRLTTGIEHVYSGCNGYVAAFRHGQISDGPVWVTQLPGGSGITSVLRITDFIYAACNGVVYQVGAQDGAVIRSFHLPLPSGTTPGEVRLATGLEGGVLFAGCSGFAFGITLTGESSVGGNTSVSR